MISEELINQMIPPLKPTDLADKAIIWMEELRTNQLPVVNQEQFLGLISEEIILESGNLQDPINHFDLIGTNCFINKNQHFYDAVRLASDNNVQLVGVLDDDKTYLGTMTIQDIVSTIAQTAAVKTPGSILVLSMANTDYSLTEISRLIEAENAKILSCSIKDDETDNSKLKLTIKINQSNLNHIVATLERFDYKIIARYQETGQLQDQKDRLDILFKYLEI